jgi:hypothetical protein
MPEASDNKDGGAHPSENNVYIPPGAGSTVTCVRYLMSRLCSSWRSLSSGPVCRPRFACIRARAAIDDGFGRFTKLMLPLGCVKSEDAALTSYSPLSGSIQVAQVSSDVLGLSRQDQTAEVGEPGCP